MNTTRESFSPNGKRGYCGVLALANVSNIPLETMFSMVKQKFGRRGNWCGSTTHLQRLTMLKLLGIDFTVSNQYIKMTVKRFCKEFASKDCVYMVTVSGHVVVVKNGQYIVDQSGTHHRLEHRSRMKRIKNVVRIINEYE